MLYFNQSKTKGAQDRNEVLTFYLARNEDSTF